MKTYALLALSGFINDSVLTAYYVHANRGHALTCVALCTVQQVLSIFQAHQTLAVEGLTGRERVLRLTAAATGYIAAAYVTVTGLA